MLRIPAFIAVLTLIATTATGASAAQPQGGSNTKGCFNRDKCMTGECAIDIAIREPQKSAIRKLVGSIARQLVAKEP